MKTKIYHKTFCKEQFLKKRTHSGCYMYVLRKTLLSLHAIGKRKIAATIFSMKNKVDTMNIFFKKKIHLFTLSLRGRFYFCYNKALKKQNKKLHLSNSRIAIMKNDFHSYDLP